MALLAEIDQCIAEDKSPADTLRLAVAGRRLDVARCASRRQSLVRKPILPTAHFDHRFGIEFYDDGIVIRPGFIR